jgi:hypothetical protein
MEFEPRIGPLDHVRKAPIKIAMAPSILTRAIILTEYIRWKWC